MWPLWLSNTLLKFSLSRIKFLIYPQLSSLSQLVVSLPLSFFGQKIFSHFSSLLPNSLSANLASSYFQSIFSIPSLITVSIATAQIQVANISHLGCNGLFASFPSTQQPARVSLLKPKTDQIDLLLKSLPWFHWV